MEGYNRKPYVGLLLLPLICAVSLWLSCGFPNATELTVEAYYVQMLTTVLTIAGVPLLLKYVTPVRQKERYGLLCMVRMTLLCALAVAEVLLYYFYCTATTFYYLGIITWLAMFFALPSKKRDTELDENNTDNR